MINYMQQLDGIARVNPRLAAALLRSNPQAPQTYSITVPFGSGAADVPAYGTFDTPVTQDFWVYAVEYQVQQPTAFLGSLFRGQEVYYNALNPDIVASLTVTGGVGLPWLFSSNPQPVESLAKPMTGPGGEGRFGACSNFVMFFPQSVKATAYLKREYADDALPILTLSFAGLTLGCKNYGGLSIRQAQDILRSEYGIQIPSIEAAAR